MRRGASTNMISSTYRSRICLAALLWASMAPAHTVISEVGLPAGTLQFVTFRIAHACGESPTTSLRVLIPDNVMRVTAGYVPGWQVDVKLRKLDTPYKSDDGTVVAETVAEITWTGGPVPKGLFAEFKLQVFLPNTPGKTLYFKTIQKCEKGELRWIEVPKAGEADYNFDDPTNPVHKAKEPSPFLKLLAPPSPAH